MSAIDWKRFRQAYLQARQRYLSYEGVLGVGYGPRTVKGKELDELAIIILVAKKLAPDGVPKDQLLPRTVDGFPIDVRELRVERQANEEQKPTIGHSDLFMIDWGKIHRIHLKELAKVPPAAPPNTAVVGQVFVIEDNGTLITDATGFSSIDWAQAYQYFLDSWGDDYDFVAMYVDTASGMPDPGASYGDTIYNDVVGINHWRGDSYDDRSAYGTTRLQGLEVMLPSTNRYVRLQETGHRWGAYVLFKNNAAEPVDHDDLLRSDNSHWAEKFDNDISSMDYDGVDWVPNPDGSFTRRTLADDEYAYCPLDLYLMGMMAPSEVPGFIYVNSLTPAPTPADPDRYTGTPVNLMVQNVAWSHGWRTPTAANSPRSFRQAFIVLTKTLADGQTLAGSIDDHRIAHTTEFRSSTLSRSMLDTYLYTDPYDGVYISDNSADIGIEPSSGAFWNSPDIWVRNVDDGGTIHQDTIRAQDNFVYVRVRNNGAQPSGEITVNVFRANYVGTEFLYPEDWQLEDLIGSQVITSVPAGGEVVAKFKWDKAIIPPATWHPCLLAEVLPIHRIKTMLRHVREDRRIAQKNITIIDIAPPPGSRFVTLPFSIGARSLPARWVRIRVDQKEGAPVDEAALDLGEQEWLDRLGKVEVIGGISLKDAFLGNAQSARLTAFARGGQVVEREGRHHLVIADALKGGDIALPLLEAERQEFALRLDLGEPLLARDLRFEITQLNERDEIVGGADLVVRRG
jgi:hypothetical protein